jgi:dipeptidase E
MIADCDLMYFGGGNTFYILDMIRKNKIDKVVKKFIKANKLYIGISAGALIPSPDISIAGWSRYVYDENSINLKNLKGLNIIGTVVMPHTNAKVITEAHDLRKRSKHKIVFISDSEAAVFTDYNKYYKI